MGFAWPNPSCKLTLPVCFLEGLNLQLAYGTSRPSEMVRSRVSIILWALLRGIAMGIQFKLLAALIRVQIQVNSSIRDNPSLLLPFRLPCIPLLLLRPLIEDLRQPDSQSFSLLRPTFRGILPCALPYSGSLASRLRDAASCRQVGGLTNWCSRTLAIWPSRRRSFGGLESGA